MGKVTRRSQKERDLAVEIVKNGGTFEEASKKTGYKTDYVRQLCTKAGVHKPKFKIDKEKERTAVLMLEDGATIDNVAATLGYRVAAVRNICSRHGFKQISDKKVSMDKRNNRIIELRKSGKSMNDIAKEVCVSFGIVESVCRKNNLGGNRAVRELETRVCKNCGRVFLCDVKSNKQYCSMKCNRQYTHSVNDVKRKRMLKSQIIDEDITLKHVAKRDHDVCQICGGKVDWNDYKFVNGKKTVLGNYPSVDHIVPLSLGGTHSWENVQLAHICCNSSKGVKVCG